MTTDTKAQITNVTAAAYTVPTDEPEADATLAWDSTTVVVCTITAAGTTGMGYTYAHPACVPLIRDTLADLVRGHDAMDVPGAWLSMQHGIRNLGRPGLVSCAMSAVETALYDAKARLLDLPLASLLGRVRSGVPVYGSGGFTTYEDTRTRAQLERWVGQQSLDQVKIKIGESWGQATARDIHRVALARTVIGDDVDLFVDANGGYGVAQAIRMGRTFEEYGVTWFEEPVSSDHLTGLREVRQHVSADVTAGEYGYHLPYFAGMLDAHAVDCLQVDVTRCGGYDEWLRAAGTAAGQGIEVSGHCAPNLSAHVAAATPNVRHLEFFHDHERIEELLFDGCLAPVGGALCPDLSTSGHGLTLKHTSAEEYRVA